MICQFQLAPGARVTTLRATLRLLAGHEGSAPQRLERLYLDSFDRRLTAAGWVLEADRSDTGETSLRLRHCRAEDYEPMQCDPPLPRTAADCSRPRLRSRLARLLEGRALLVESLGQLRVEQFDCLDPQGKLVAVVRLEQPTQGRRPPVLRVQAVTGFAPASRRIVRALRASGLVLPLRVDCADHLRQQLGLAVPAYAAKPVVRLRAGSGAARALARLLTAYTATLRANEAGIISDWDSEFLHDYRVALRSIRSWLGELKSCLEAGARAEVKASLAHLNRMTGALRDLDVLCASLPAYLTADDGAAAGRLAAQVSAARASARQDLIDYLQSDSYVVAMRRWSDFLTALAQGEYAGRRGRQRVDEVLGRALAKRRASILAFDADKAREDATVMHELRKECKKLRYLLEGFQCLFDPEVRDRAVLELKTLQTATGEIQDLHVHLGLLTQLAQAAPDRDDEPAAVAGLLQRLHGRLRTLEVAQLARVTTALARFGSRRVQRIFDRLQEKPA